MALSLSAWMFGMAVLGLMLTAWFFLLLPLFRNSDEADDANRKQANIDLFRQQVAELEQSFELGEISENDLQAQKKAFERQLLDSTVDLPTQALSVKTTGDAWLYVAAAMFIPVLSVVIYLQGDGWRLLGSSEESPPWDFIIHRAEKRIENNPEDLETLTFLARSYRALEQYANSAQTYGELNRLTEYRNPEFLVEEGEMLALMDEGNLQGLPTERFQQALKANPLHGRALWYAGLSAVQRNDQTAAIEFWQTLAGQELPESFRAVLERQLRKMGVVPASGPRTVPGKAVINVKVEIDNELVKGLPPETPVFVYARAIDGQAKPLAAQRLQLNQLPANVVLTDAMAMDNGPKLSGQPAWRIIARVSLGGNASSQAGDPIGQITLNKSDALAGKTIRINSRQK